MDKKPQQPRSPQQTSPSESGPEVGFYFDGARMKRTNRVMTDLTKENFEWVKKIAEIHNQSMNYVVDRAVEAAKWNVPFVCEYNIPRPVKRAMELLNAKRSLESRAKRALQEKTFHSGAQGGDAGEGAVQDGVED